MRQGRSTSSGTIASAKARQWSEVRISSPALDVVVAIGLFGAALAIRLPNLMLMPAFTDETGEVLHSLPILHGTSILLTNADPYYGSLFNYLIAIVFYLFGPSAEHARLMVTVLGAATVPLVYFFAKAAEGRATGIVAGLMMLTSAALVWNGHVAWENETTPFFATLTFLVLTLALKRGNGPLLVASGFCFGLTLQTHPGLVILGAGLLIYFVYSGLRASALKLPRTLRAWVTSPWPYFTLVGAALSYGNVIAQSVLHPESGWLAAQRHTYAYVPSQTLDGYLTDLQNFWVMALRMASSSFDGRGTPADYLLVPINLLYLAVLVAGGWYAFKTGKLLPVIVLFTTGFVLPYFNKSYGYPMAARYVGYLFPMLYLLAAAPLARAVRGIGGQPLTRLYVLLLVGFLIVAPLISLVGYYRSQAASGNTNAGVLAVYDALHRQYLTGDISEVLIDRTVGDELQGGGGTVARSEDYLLTLDGVPHRSVVVTPAELRAALRRAGSRGLGLIVTVPEFRSLSGQFRLSALDLPMSGGKGRAKYAGYVVRP